MTRRRTPLLARSDAGRSASRVAVDIAGTWRIDDRVEEAVVVTDVGANGCRLRGHSLGVTKSAVVKLMIGTIGPIGARLVWIRRGSLGLAFDAPLDPIVLEGLRELAPPEPNVVPLRRAPAA